MDIVDQGSKEMQNSFLERFEMQIFYGVLTAEMLISATNIAHRDQEFHCQRRVRTQIPSV